MSDNELAYPSDASGITVTNRRFDAEECLIGWCVRQGASYIAYRVASFHQVTLDDGTTLEVPARVCCQFSDREIDPMSVSIEEGSASAVEGEGTKVLFQEMDVDPALRYHRARSYDPSVGRWISDDPLGCDGSDADSWPYPHFEKPIPRISPEHPG